MQDTAVLSNRGPAGLRLETERLVLRELTAADARALLPILGDAENMCWYPRAFTAAEIETGIQRQMARYRTGTGLLGMVLHATGELIGDCGPVWQEVEGVSELEVGYHVHPSFQRRGLATEAARAVRDYAFASLGVDHIISMIRPENLPSRRVAEKNGLKVDRVVFWRDYDHCVYRLARVDVR